MKTFFARLASLGVVACALAAPPPAPAGDMTVDLGPDASIASVGAVRRWDDDGKALTPVDPKAKIDAPRVDAQAVRQDESHWVFRDFPPGGMIWSS